MSLCEHCSCRGSWDCEDRYYYPEDCDDFKLDYDTLSNKQKKKIKKIMSREEEISVPELL